MVGTESCCSIAIVIHDALPITEERVDVISTEEGWRAVVRIPFSTLGVKPPQDNERWEFNVCRYWKGADKTEELSSWAELGAFNQTSRFGELAFSSRAEVDADIAYWEAEKHDPHLRRSRVSGLAVARQTPDTIRSYWQYDPFAFDQMKVTQWGMRGLSTAAYAEITNRPGSAERDCPDLYRTADLFNQAILRLSLAKLRGDEFFRMAAYESREDAGAVQRLAERTNALEKTLDQLYADYLEAFPSKEAQVWNPVYEKVAAFSAAVEKLLGDAEAEPGNEEAMFAYLQSLARRKRVPVACFEHYTMMYSRLEGDDERAGANSVRRHLFDLTARDVQYQAYWLGYMGQAVSYVAAYGGATFRVDTEQTILRWPSAEIRRYRHQLEPVEGVLLQSAPVPGQIAVFIPDRTFIQTLNLQDPAKEEVPMDRFIRFQNAVLSPASLPAEYLHEEMLEGDDAEAELNRYSTLVVLDAAFVKAPVLERLKRWAAQPGRTLVINGPLGFFDECGQPLPAEASPQRTAFPGLELDLHQPWKLKPAKAAPGCPWLRSAPFGEGTVVLMEQPLNAFLDRPEKLHSLVQLLESRVQRSVKVKGTLRLGGGCGGVFQPLY